MIKNNTTCSLAKVVDMNIHKSSSSQHGSNSIYYQTINQKCSTTIIIVVDVALIIIEGLMQ